MMQLFRGIVICVFMLNMVYVAGKQDEKRSIKEDMAYKARRARMMEVNKQLAIYQVEMELRKDETVEAEKPVLAGY
jgi:hypothetical protein